MASTDYRVTNDGTLYAFNLRSKGPLVDVTHRDFGADPTGAADSTAEIQAAIDSISSGVVLLPPGEFLVSDTLIIPNDRVSIWGLGKQLSKFTFNPATPKPLISIIKSPAAVSYQNSLKGFSINGSGAVQKIGIRATDTSELEIEDVAMQTMTGNSSIGLQLRGKDMTFVNKLSLSADIPISIETNPNSSISIDHAHFQNCYLIAAVDKPCIQIASGVNLTNVLFDGYQAWVLGKYGIYWNDVASAAASLNLIIKNARHEQSTDASGNIVYINHNYALQNLVLDNIYGGTYTKGYYFRKVQTWQIRDSTYVSGTNEALNFDNTTYSGRGINNYWQTGATASISSMNLVLAQGSFVNADLATDFLYQSTNTIANRIGVELLPMTDDTIYLGRSTAPFTAFKGLIVKDTTNGKHYVMQVVNGSLQVYPLD